jgi:hypothetical protein
LPAILPQLGPILLPPLGCKYQPNIATNLNSWPLNVEAHIGWFRAYPLVMLEFFFFFFLFSFLHVISKVIINIKDVVWKVTTLIIPFSKGDTNSQSTHYLAKFQSYWGLEFLLDNTKFIDMCSFTLNFKKTTLNMILNATNFNCLTRY